MVGKIIQGNNNVTRLEGERILKTPKQSDIFIQYEQNYEQQVKQWNLYYKDTSYATACITDGQLSTPFIKGRVPSDEEVLACLEEMKGAGWLMLDCQDNTNFIVDQNNKVCPVDFGQVYFEGTYKGIFFESYKSQFVQKISEKEQSILNKIKEQNHKNISADTNISSVSINSGLSNVTKSTLGFITTVGVGAGVGALLGTFVFPGIGTLIGAAIGAGFGGSAGLTGVGLINLFKGNVKSGTSLFATGAAGAGALLGTIIFPGIGTAVGAAIGFGAGVTPGILTFIGNGIKRFSNNKKTLDVAPNPDNTLLGGDVVNISDLLKKHQGSQTIPEVNPTKMDAHTQSSQQAKTKQTKADEQTPTDIKELWQKERKLSEQDVHSEENGSPSATEDLPTKQL